LAGVKEADVVPVTVPVRVLEGVLVKEGVMEDVLDGVLLYEGV